jgi:hypothetical protein
VDSAAPGRRQPLYLAGLEVEDVHDGPRDPEQIPQGLHDGLGDRHRSLLGDHRLVDLVQDPQTLGVLSERLLRRLELLQDALVGIVRHGRTGCRPGSCASQPASRP